MKLKTPSESLPRISRILWITFLAIGVIGLVLMIINTYGFYTYSGSPDADHNYRTEAREFGIFPYYFTFLSNLSGVIVALLVVFKLVKFSNQHLGRAKVLMVTNLTVTFIFYWALLAPTADWSKPFGVISNLFVHLITPVLSVVTFVYDILLGTNKTLKVWTTSLVNFLMPLLWFAFTIGLYFAYGANGKADVPYKFLDLLHNPVGSTVGIVLGVAGGYFVITAFYTLIGQLNFKPRCLRRWKTKTFQGK